MVFLLQEITMNTIIVYLSKWNNICISSTLGKNICIFLHGITSVSLYSGQEHLYLYTWHNIYITLNRARTSLSLYFGQEHLYLSSLTRSIYFSVVGKALVSLHMLSRTSLLKASTSLLEEKHLHFGARASFLESRISLPRIKSSLLDDKGIST
ncbi:hypothetical protein BDB01DRAFT_450698 [Pilobolus umbonatus]|nr:hypothetical protein BDB01DRAFT_450698 [Pilobolus umbonatus]